MGLKTMKILQLNEYNMVKTFKHFFKSYFMWAVAFSAVGFFLIYFFTRCMLINFYSVGYSYILLATYMFFLFFCFLDSGDGLPKLTKRLWRLFALSSLVLVGGFSLACVFSYSHPQFLYSLPTLMPIIGYLLIYLCNLILVPIELMIKKYYVCRTKVKLEKRDDLLVIGITGSFGKTSTKNFLDMILSEKYVVLSTPKNYNTPMGVTKTVLNNMTPNQEIFIVEMGAYKCGDIAEICRLVRPQIGIVTSIGNQHLNSFKTLENVYKTKNELVNSLPQKGTAFFNLDNDLCKKAFEECQIERVGVSLKSDMKDTEGIFVADNVQMTNTGVCFSVGLNGKKVDFTAKVLGRHNISNLLLAIAVAHKLGLDELQIRRGVAKIRAVAHRLELKQLSSGDLLIDDAYNSNIVGFKNALEVMDGYNSKKKIIVTPGIIDLGKQSASVNFEIGKEIAGVADEVIIVKDTNKTAIKTGLLSVGFDETHMYYANSFKDAQKQYCKLLDGNSIVLIENDLPENYK